MKFNDLFTGSPKFTFNADNNQYISITEFLKDHSIEDRYVVHGMFVTKTGKYGPRGVVVLDGYNLYVPKHKIETINKIRETPELVDLINSGHCDMIFREYEKDGQNHITVDFVDPE